ncbi:MAG: oligoendopeptidase F [Ruminococcaceae bacterium]|nr:oligoendopeptidase F [Oscillospiraceae bacterium]
MRREEISNEYKWKLTDLYADNQLWEEDFSRLKEDISRLAGFAGTLHDGTSLLEALACADATEELAIKLFAYARMRRDEDNTVDVYQEITERITSALTELSAASAFLCPEIVAIGEETVDKWCDENEHLAIYRQFFGNIFREAKHTLSNREEEILALAGQVTDAGGDVFDMYNNADIRFDKISDANGKSVQLTHGNYSVFLENADRAVRKAAFDAMYKPYTEHQNTLAATLSSNVKKNCFYATVRKYESAREMALSEDAISTDVYDNLIATVDENLPKLHEYLRLRKEILGVDELHMYDLYTPIVQNVQRTYTFEEACDLVLSAVAPLGEQYQNDLRSAFASGWIDVMENDGKTPGAYSWGSNSEHPFVLLNFHGTLDDVFTLAHEMGHAMHSFYTNRTQPSVYKNYKIFVAEVASTVNEALLMEYLLKIEQDTEMRAYLLNHKLESCRTTLYRQTMFAEFERGIHAHFENGGGLTAQWMMDYYRSLNEKYFAPICHVDDEIAMEWARIPHFYSDFYVYQYATGYSAAQALCFAILTEGEPAVKRYLAFLASGNSAYPLQLLKTAGVDLTQPEPIRDALEGFSHACRQFRETGFGRKM